MQTNSFISNPITKVLVYANVFIAICALAQVLLTYVVFCIPVDFKNNSYLLFVFLSTYLQYNVQRGYLINANNVQTDRSQWLIKHKKKLFISIAASLIIVLFLCNSLSYTSIAIMVGAEVLSTFYYLPPFNLRKQGYIKPFLVSSIWVISCCLVPLIENNILTTNNMWFLLSQFFFITVLCLLFDLKDATDDFLNGVNTYANKFGELKTKLFSFMILVLAGTCFYLYTKNSTLLLFTGVLYTITAITIFISNEKKHSFYYYLWIDGLMLIQGAGLYILIKSNEDLLNNLLHNL